MDLEQQQIIRLTFSSLSESTPMESWIWTRSFSKSFSLAALLLNAWMLEMLVSREDRPRFFDRLKKEQRLTDRPRFF